ncbi:zinc finger, CCHC-type containing protein [Tanacetum coccineum]
MAFGGNIRDLGSFGKETDKITTLHQESRRIVRTERGDGVTIIKRQRQDLHRDGVKDLVTASGRGRFKEDLESSTWRRRQDFKATPSHRSITTWEDLTTHFLTQFFPPGRNAKLRNDILMFQQHQEESLSEAWTHYAAEGRLRKLSVENAWATIEKLAQYEDEGWNDPVIPKEGNLNYKNPDIEQLLGVISHKEIKGKVEGGGKITALILVRTDVLSRKRIFIGALVKAALGMECVSLRCKSDILKQKFLAPTVSSLMAYFVAILTPNSARSCVMQSTLPTKGMRSIISTVSISLEGFLPSILLLVVTVVIVAIILVVVVVAIVRVVIVVAIIRVVVVVMIIGIVGVVSGVPSIIKLSFMIIGFLHRIALQYLVH